MNGLKINYEIVAMGNIQLRTMEDSRLNGILAQNRDAIEAVWQNTQKEKAGKLAEWMNRAELAVDRKDDELARAALDRAMSFQQLTESLDREIEDQETQVESLKAALKKLESKLLEARAKADLLIMQHRRSRAARRAVDAQQAPNGESRIFERMRAKVAREDALSKAAGELLGDDLDTRLQALERDRKIDSLLREIKARKGIGA